MKPTLTFRWLGVAGIELMVDEQILLVDPYFSRISFWHQWFGSVHSNSALVRGLIQRCDYILVTHAHWDHLMDVPEVAEFTGAVVFGSSNTCQLLRVLGVANEQVREIHSGAELTLGPFAVRTFSAQHKNAPGFLPGQVAPNLRPPLRARDYRMDACFSFMITAEKIGLLTDPGDRPARADPADILLVSPRYDFAQLQPLVQRVLPKVIMPNHWDDFWRPLSKPVRPMIGPPAKSIPPMRRVDLSQFRRTIERIDPRVKVFIPDIFTPYRLHDIMDTA
jgi:L-ascorbate metabolism protein UlaG (beta-lactamase superfamily)